MIASAPAEPMSMPRMSAYRPNLSRAVCQAGRTLIRLLPHLLQRRRRAASGTSVVSAMASTFTPASLTHGDDDVHAVLTHVG
jgi:hypothetical protein